MISFCIIGKNEEAILEQCLLALVPYGYEIVFVDTGSTDRTKEIARKYTDKVYDFVWKNDFSAARNFSISKANGEFVLPIDCDEIVVEFDKVKTEQLIKLYPDKVGRLLIVDDFSRKVDSNSEISDNYASNVRVSRLFSKNKFHYEGRIHEQVVSIDGGDISTYNIPLRMLHSGYNGNEEVLRKKAERNRNLLLIEYEKNPDDPYILYQLGQTYFMEHDYEHALVYYDKMLAIDVNPRLEYVQNGVEAYGYSLVETKQYEKALGLIGVYDTFAVTADFVFLMGLIYMYNGMLEEAVGEFLKATKCKEVRVHGTNSFRAYYNIGVIYECVGMIDEACEYYKKAGDYVRARQRLSELKKESAE